MACSQARTWISGLIQSAGELRTLEMTAVAVMVINAVGTKITQASHDHDAGYYRRFESIYLVFSGQFSSAASMGVPG